MKAAKRSGAAAVSLWRLLPENSDYQHVVQHHSVTNTAPSTAVCLLYTNETLRKCWYERRANAKYKQREIVNKSHFETDVLNICFYYCMNDNLTLIQIIYIIYTNSELNQVYRILH